MVCGLIQVCKIEVWCSQKQLLIPKIYYYRNNLNIEDKHSNPSTQKRTTLNNHCLSPFSHSKHITLTYIIVPTFYKITLWLILWKNWHWTIFHPSYIQFQTGKNLHIHFLLCFFFFLDLIPLFEGAGTLGDGVPQKSLDILQKCHSILNYSIHNWHFFSHLEMLMNMF